MPREPTPDDFRLFGTYQPALGWIADPTGYIYWYNQAWYTYTGTTPEQMEGWGWQSVHDPDVLHAVIEKWINSIATGQPFEMVFPLKGADGLFRPFLTRVIPRHDADGTLTHWLGNNTEVTQLVEFEQSRLLLVRELHHRIKNIFTALHGLISFTARQATSPQEMASVLIGRLTAKAKAQELIRPKVGQTADVLETPTTLGELLKVVVQNQASIDSRRVTLDGPSVPISPGATEALALIFFELTTNSSKYGALSNETGTIQISWSVDGEALAVSWTETNGPAISGQPGQNGFGSQLVELFMRTLGGSMTTERATEGFRLRLSLPLSQISPWLVAA